MKIRMKKIMLTFAIAVVGCILWGVLESTPQADRNMQVATRFYAKNRTSDFFQRSTSMGRRQFQQHGSFKSRH